MLYHKNFNFAGEDTKIPLLNYVYNPPLDCVPALPDWRTQVREALPFMKRLEEMAAIQESIENSD